MKILIQETPELLLSQDSAKLAQLMVLEVFPTNEARRPLFTLGVVSSIACDIGSNLGTLSYTVSIPFSCFANRFHHAYYPAGLE